MEKRKEITKKKMKMKKQQKDVEKSYEMRRLKRATVKISGS